MSTLALLMGLLLLAYAGSFMVGRRRLFSLPSGIEYVALGFALGAHGFDLLADSLVAAFDPISTVALGWLALLVGLSFGTTGGARVSLGRLLLGSLSALVTGGVVALAVWEILGSFNLAQHMSLTDRILIAGGIGAACGETSRRAIRVILERANASGPLSDFLAELGTADDLLPLVAAAVLFGIHPPWTVALLAAHGPLLEALAWGGATLALGTLLGLAGVILLADELRTTQAWSVLLGVSLLGVGLCSRLGLSPISAMFAMGLTLKITSRHGEALRALVLPTERGVLHPALLLAGAHIDPTVLALPWLAFAALLARIAGKALFGAGALVVSKTARRGGILIGLGLMPCGGLAMTVGFAFALRFPGRVGISVLSVAACATALGELLGPISLNLTLKRAGELHPKTTTLPIPDAGIAVP